MIVAFGLSNVNRAVLFIVSNLRFENNFFMSEEQKQQQTERMSRICAEPL